MKLSALGSLAALLAPLVAGPQISAQTGSAYLSVDLRRRTEIATARPDLLDTPIAPGAIVKMAMLVAPGGAGVDAAELAADRLAAPVQRFDATLRIGVAHDGGYSVRTIPIEEYVAGVLTGEAAPGSSPATLEALAITIRTYAIANLGRHRAAGFDLCDLTHCQVLRKGTPATERAAAATADRILTRNGAPASVYYSASCGGHTERPSEVWPGADDVPYLPSRTDDACENGPEWTTDLSAADLARALRAGGFTAGTLRGLKVARRNSSGRVTRVRLEGLTPDEISGADLRTLVGNTLGWQHLKSTAFDVRRTRSGFQFSGRGFGHGVGLCVIGSIRLGEQGRSASEILARYFPGLQVSRQPASPLSVAATLSDIVVQLPEGDEGERQVIESLAVQARDALVRELGVAAPARIALRFHPTVESYQRATGPPWFPAGATVSGVVDLVPLSALRERGLVERTVRHELVHVLTEKALASRPLWVREGAAAYFARERRKEPVRADDRRRLACPPDRDLRQPVSPGAFSAAYARAAACFTRQIESGKKWTEIK